MPVAVTPRINTTDSVLPSSLTPNKIMIMTIYYTGLNRVGAVNYSIDSGLFIQKIETNVILNKIRLLFRFLCDYITRVILISPNFMQGNS